MRMGPLFWPVRAGGKPPNTVAGTLPDLTTPHPFVCNLYVFIYLHRLTPIVSHGIMSHE